MSPSVPTTAGLSSGCSLRSRVVSASTPPSPLLSARRTMPTYLTEMTSSRDQKMSDRMPSTLSASTLIPEMSEKQARRA